MRLLTFAIIVYVVLALETGLRVLLSVPGPTGVSPSFMLILAVYVSLTAPAPTVAWTTLLLGLLVDLRPIGLGEQSQDVVLIGPACLGYFVGGYVAVQVRGMLFRESPITMGIMVFIMGIFVHLVIVALVTLRGLPIVPADGIAGWHAAEQLGHRFGELVYTAVVAVPLGFVLMRFDSLWRLSPLAGRGRHAGRGGA